VQESPPGSKLSRNRELARSATRGSLKVRRATLGTLEVTGVGDRVSFATYVPSDPNVPARGDMVVMPK